ncbi:glycoside hydrolase family 5 protein, partial [Pseudomonas sp. MAG002Y]|nr:glycoside hydrolase family 5 protein [Pseudomonas sp. MAG002Y]
NPRWNILMDNMLAYLKENCVPASYWAAGPGWGNYFMSVEPVNGQDRPQWPTLKKYMDSSSCTEIGPKKAGASTTPTPSTPSVGTTPVATTPSTGTGSSTGPSTSVPPAATPVTTTPVAGADGAVSSVINNFTNADWLNGVYRKKAGFSIPATAANKAAFIVGASVRLANGEVRKISAVQIGTNMAVYLEGAPVNGSIVGYPNKLALVSAVLATSTINDFTNADWLNGVYRKKAGFSIPGTSTNQAAFKAGGSVRLATGEVRKITYVQAGKNLAVYLDGAPVNGSTVGYPKTLAALAN